jgi:hypothetical protein
VLPGLRTRSGEIGRRRRLQRRWANVSWRLARRPFWKSWISSLIQSETESGGFSSKALFLSWFPADPKTRPGFGASESMVYRWGVRAIVLLAALGPVPRLWPAAGPACLQRGCRRGERPGDGAGLKRLHCQQPHVRIPTFAMLSRPLPPFVRRRAAWQLVPPSTASARSTPMGSG